MSIYAMRYRLAGEAITQHILASSIAHATSRAFDVLDATGAAACGFALTLE